MFWVPCNFPLKLLPPHSLSNAMHIRASSVFSVCLRSTNLVANNFFLNTTFKEQVCPTSFPVPHYNLSFLVKGIQKSVQSPVRGKETISWLVLPLQQQLLDKEHSFSKNCPPSFLLQKIIFLRKIISGANLSFPRVGICFASWTNSQAPCFTTRDFYLV